MLRIAAPLSFGLMHLQPAITDALWQKIGNYTVYPQTRHLSARVRAFIDFLAQRFAGEPYWGHHLPIAGLGPTAP